MNLSLNTLFSKNLLIAAFSVLVTQPAQAADFAGRVTRVIDGDTIEVLANSRPIRVRLAGIDAPERKCSQPFWDASRQSLASLVAGQHVVIKDRGQDRYGRSLGTVEVRGSDVNAEQVRRGYAWHYRAYSKDPRLSVLEASARLSNRGLWNAPGAVAPWAWRKTCDSNGQTPDEPSRLPLRGATRP